MAIGDETITGANSNHAAMGDLLRCLKAAWIATPEADCICLAVTDAPLKFSSWLVQPILEMSPRAGQTMQHVIAYGATTFYRLMRGLCSNWPVVTPRPALLLRIKHLVRKRA